MRPVDALGGDEARGLVGMVFDLDDTVLDGGALGLAAYAALFDLARAGLGLVACTGRPSGWGEVVARQWPVAAVVVENGAFAWVRDASAASVRVTSTDCLDPAARAARRAPLLDLAHELVAAHPEAALADDNAARTTDVTLDIGEHRRVAPAVVGALRDAARALGVTTHASSIHLHLASEPDDKASGTLRLLGERFGEDPTGARRRWAYVGDSGNDAQAFAAFSTTFAVANVREHLGALTVPPRFVARRPRGEGFAEIARALVRLRGGVGHVSR